MKLEKIIWIECFLIRSISATARCLIVLKGEIYGEKETHRNDLH
jgi:hypothetical protein